MKKSLKIVGVRTIFNIDRPIVVFDVANHPAIVRNPKQALVDMQNSGRCLGISSDALSRGIEGMNAHAKGLFTKALLRTRGANIEGDFTVVKAGDKYVPNDNHPIFTDKSYPGFGTLKSGETLTADKDGVWVDGFCTIPETDAELNREADADAYANVRVAMLGLSMDVPTAVAETLPDAEAQALPNPTAQEAFGAKEETAKVK